MADVFEHFVAAVADRVLTVPADPARALRDVLEKWRQFLIPSGWRRVGRDKLAAVLGELLVLRDIVRADPIGRVDSWVGPFGGRHDFRRSDTTALEVKTTRVAHVSRGDYPRGGPARARRRMGTLHLHFVRLEEVPSRRRVGRLGRRRPARGWRRPPIGCFEALAASGVPPAELAATGDVSFDVREQAHGSGRSTQTPRIVPSSFVGELEPDRSPRPQLRDQPRPLVERALTRPPTCDLISRLAERS